MAHTYFVVKTNRFPDKVHIIVINSKMLPQVIFLYFSPILFGFKCTSYNTISIAGKYTIVFVLFVINLK